LVLGVLAFQVALAGAGSDGAFHAGELAASIGTGLVVGALGAALLWLLLRGLQRSAPGQGVAAALMMVVGALVVADLIREDSGFLATTVMGVVLANQTQLDISKVLAFQGTVVNLLIAILFVLISASVEPSQVWDLLPQGSGWWPSWRWSYVPSPSRWEPGDPSSTEASAHSWPGLLHGASSPRRLPRPLGCNWPRRA
jgi:NhaP-type Na+/H+ or K+/H+ antiporter